MRESQTTTSIFLLVLFSIEKFIFCQKIYLEELSLYCYICITVFFHVTGYWKCRNKTLTPIQTCIGFLDTVLRTKILDGLLFFIYISEKQIQFRKKQKHLSRKIFGSLQITWSNQIYCEIDFQSMYISKIWTYNLERNWKNSVCIGVKNFANM